jgi:hypothetical protein
MLRTHFYETKINNNESLSRCYLNRVFAPEGELLSFAPPKVSSQRKGGPITAYVLRSSHLSGGRQKRLPASLPPCGIHAAPLTGYFPTNTAVLDAVNGRKTRYCVTLGIIFKLDKLQ